MQNGFPVNLESAGREYLKFINFAIQFKNKVKTEIDLKLILFDMWWWWIFMFVGVEVSEFD